jgi:hypothetical protein
MSDNEIKIIGPAKSAAIVEQTDYVAREGEKTDDTYQEQFKFAFFNKKSISHLEEEADKVAEKLNGLVKRFAKVVTESAELDEITIGLAVSIEGDIGLASAGAEASIELKFKVIKEPKLTPVTAETQQGH